MALRNSASDKTGRYVNSSAPCAPSAASDLAIREQDPFPGMEFLYAFALDPEGDRGRATWAYEEERDDDMTIVVPTIVR
jgi:hypothetical protein